MGQSSNVAEAMVVQIKLRKEECALSMGQSSNVAEAMVVLTKLSKEECAGGMGHIAIQTMNLLYLDQNSVSLLHLNPIRMLLELPSQHEVQKVSPERCPYSVKKYTKFNTSCIDVYVRRNEALWEQISSQSYKGA